MMYSTQNFILRLPTSSTCQASLYTQHHFHLRHTAKIDQTVFKVYVSITTLQNFVAVHLPSTAQKVTYFLDYPTLSKDTDKKKFRHRHLSFQLSSTAQKIDCNNYICTQHICISRTMEAIIFTKNSTWRYQNNAYESLPRYHIASIKIQLLYANAYSFYIGQ